MLPRQDRLQEVESSLCGTEESERAQKGAICSRYNPKGLVLAALSGRFGEVVQETGFVLFEYNHGTVFDLTESFFLFSKEFTQQRRRLWRKRLLKSEFTLFQNSSIIFYVVQFVKCWIKGRERGEKREEKRKKSNDCNLSVLVLSSLDERVAILVVTFSKIQLEINNKLHIDLYLTNHEHSQKETKENKRRI